jgi:hypothetical protein
MKTKRSRLEKEVIIMSHSHLARSTNERTGRQCNSDLGVAISAQQSKSLETLSNVAGRTNLRPRRQCQGNLGRPRRSSRTASHANSTQTEVEPESVGGYKGKHFDFSAPRPRRGQSHDYQSYDSQDRSEVCHISSMSFRNGYPRSNGCRSRFVGGA